MDKNFFAIVAFVDENDDVAVVPGSWLIGKGMCYWPPYTCQQRNNKAVKDEETPTENRRKHLVRILGVKDSYEKTRSYLSKATLTSDLQSDAESQTLRHKRIQKYPAEIFDSDSQEYNKQPQSKKSCLLTPVSIVNREWNTFEKSDQTAKKIFSPSCAPTPPPFPDTNPRSTLIKPVVSKGGL
ncbi:uncharacterized protein LOC124807864 [Hydra vulgaris]|uniref:uncharacterized protein LOC124807864 n=1 Tax=Hydra vulgaris TaxID=6087 RepID=UPI001F5F3572|nr:uncharacterized protein LOC124807864 [Hydra vulgaris]XP_047126401.1 uncharacterized protein LOC124807864 [Hydra vulgaris]